MLQIRVINHYLVHNFPTTTPGGVRVYIYFRLTVAHTATLSAIECRAAMANSEHMHFAHFHQFCHFALLLVLCALMAHIGCTDRQNGPLRCSVQAYEWPHAQHAE